MRDFLRNIDYYCERTAPGMFMEPLNTISELSAVAIGIYFIVSSLGFPRIRLWGCYLTLAGLGTMALHITGQAWASYFVTVPSFVFATHMVYGSARDLMQLSRRGAILWTLFLIGMFITIEYFAKSSAIFGSSANYLAYPVLVFTIGLTVFRGNSETAALLMIAGVSMLFALLLRALDEPFCGVLPMGTHFLWHIMMAVTIGMIIEAYRRHLVDERRLALEEEEQAG